MTLVFLLLNLKATHIDGGLWFSVPATGRSRQILLCLRDAVAGAISKLMCTNYLRRSTWEAEETLRMQGLKRMLAT